MYFDNIKEYKFTRLSKFYTVKRHLSRIVQMLLSKYISYLNCLWDRVFNMSFLMDIKRAKFTFTGQP